MNIKRQTQGGMFLLEALIAILVFSFGILGLIAMGSTAIASQADAQYRSDAATFANEIASKIALNVDLSAPPLSIQNSLQAFAHQPVVADGFCGFAGAASTSPIVLGWVDEVRGAAAGVAGLPGATSLSQSIVVDTSQANYSVVTVTVCWIPPSSGGQPHRQVLISYVPNQA
jgi:type IV pilus assembly protein PilV